MILNARASHYSSDIAPDIRSGEWLDYTYNKRNRLSAVTRNSAAWATYGYNALEQLTTRVSTAPAAPLGQIAYTYDNDNHLLTEANAATGAKTRDYIWLPSNDNSPVDLPLAVIDIVGTTHTLTHVHADHLGRPTRMTSAAKATVWSAAYKPWGEVQSLSGTVTNNLRFPGQYFQIETGLAHNHHRNYDPVTGRYIQPDPLRFVDGPSIYAYAGNSPYMNVDRSGKETTVIVTRDYGFGSHAGLYIRDNHGADNSNGFGNLLYDPAGSFDCKCGGMGSGDSIRGPDTPSLDDYLNFHQSVGSDVEIYNFNTTPKEEAEIAERIEQIGSVTGGFCAVSTSGVLDGIGPFKDLGSFTLPGNLARKLRELPRKRNSIP